MIQKNESYTLVSDGDEDDEPVPVKVKKPFILNIYYFLDSLTVK